MLLFSNRHVQAGAGASGLGATFDPFSDRLSLAIADAATGGLSSFDDDVSDAEALAQLLTEFDVPGAPLLVYVHGFNNTAQRMVERCRALQATYGLRVIGFSWPAEGLLPTGEPVLGRAPMQVGEDEEVLAELRATRNPSLADRYKQAKVNAEQSVNAFARFQRLLGTARLHANVQPYSAAFHSLGSHLLRSPFPCRAPSKAWAPPTTWCCWPPACGRPGMPTGW